MVQMSFNGFNPKEIAERLEMSYGSVKKILCDPLAKAYMNGLADRMKETTLDVRKELVSMNKDALETIKRLMDPKQKAPAAVQLNAAKDNLDRSGYKTPDQLNIDMTFKTKTDDEIDAEIAALENSINKTHQATSLSSNDEPSNDEEKVALPENETLALDEDPINETKHNEREPQAVRPPIGDDSEFDPFNHIKDSND